MRYQNPLIVGVTGGMGSGQSTVCSFLEKWGCKVINADAQAKEVISKNKQLQHDLKKVFGNDIFFNNNTLNAKRLAELAFNDELQTRKLNQLVHPRMVESLIEEMERARFSGRFPMIVIDAALIFEISIERNFDYIITVHASIKLRQQRVFQRDNISRKQFNDRVSKQLLLEDKVKWSDYVIYNKGTVEELETNTRKIFDDLMAKQKQSEKKAAS
ncbi:MAG: dephospho-CoA kinase [Calditrichae bacterium]|nr:dephospho-CoA kinase [Calditrichota bacterium]MCB9058624.1 dephospho-CoA kinase [Calditrichia bacterium]